MTDQTEDPKVRADNEELQKLLAEQEGLTLTYEQVRDLADEDWRAAHNWVLGRMFRTRDDKAEPMPACLLPFAGKSDDG